MFMLELDDTVQKTHQQMRKFCKRVVNSVSCCFLFMKVLEGQVILMIDVLFECIERFIQ